MVLFYAIPVLEISNKLQVLKDSTDTKFRDQQFGFPEDKIVTLQIPMHQIP